MWAPRRAQASGEKAWALQGCPGTTADRESTLKCPGHPAIEPGAAAKPGSVQDGRLRSVIAHPQNSPRPFSTLRCLTRPKAECRRPRESCPGPTLLQLRVGRGRGGVCTVTLVISIADSSQHLEMTYNRTLWTISKHIACGKGRCRFVEHVLL